MSYTDKQITCHDCGTVFTFSVKEQEQFASIGRFNAPKRCVAVARKENRQHQKVKVCSYLMPEIQTMDLPPGECLL